MALADAGLGRQFLDSFTFMGDHTGHLLHDTLGTIALCAAALGVALAITLPFAVWLGHLHRGASAAIRIANLGRSLPELGLIAIFLALLGIGFLNVMLALGDAFDIEFPDRMLKRSVFESIAAISAALTELQAEVMR